MTRDEIKNILIDHFKTRHDTQFMNIVHDVSQKKGSGLSPGERRHLLELIHELISSNILMPATGGGDTGWPWLSVTSHGEEMLADEGPRVYDYDGFLGEIHERIPDLDNVIDKYLRESLRSYQVNLHYASMVMLGCASERAMNLLIDAYINAIDKEENQTRLRNRINNRDISTAYSEFKKSFDTTSNQIESEDIVNDFKTHVEAIFQFIRLIRNSIVHPESMPRITNALIYANLQQFSYYIETISNLIKYLKENTITV